MGISSITKPTLPSRGDFFIFPKLDEVGRCNLRGRNTNYGYSGYVVVLVYDGKNWASVTKACLKAIGAETDYAYQYEKNDVLWGVEKKLNAFIKTNPEFEIRSWWYKNRKYAKLLPVARST